MKKFFLNLIDANSSLSSKRFSGLSTLFTVIILAFLATFKSNNWQCPDYMFNGLLLVVAGLFGFNMAENIFKRTSSQEQTTEDIVKNTNDAEKEKKPLD